MRRPVPLPLRSLAIAALAAVPWLGCSARPNALAPLPVPAVQASVDHYPGSPLRGTGTLPSEEDIAGAWAVTVRCVALERFPDEAYAALGSQLRLVVSEIDGDPIKPVAEHTGLVRFAADSPEASFDELCCSEAVGRTYAFPRLNSALARGTTMVASFRGDGEPGPDPAVPPAEVIGSLHVHRATDDTVHLALEWYVVGAHESHRELGMVEADAIEAGRTFAVVHPALRFRNDWPRGYALHITIGEAPVSPALATALTADLADAVAQKTVRDNPAIPDPAFIDAIDGLTWRTRQRDALRYLCRATGARVASDLILSAPERSIRAVAEEVHYAILQRTATSGKAPDRAAIGWTIERIGLGRLIARFREFEDAGEPAPAEWIGVLVRHAGELGRDPESFEALVHEATSLEDLHTRITTENHYFLEDVSPAARIRAFDWLTMRGVDLGGFDPLGSPAERRAALRRAEAAAAKAAAAKADDAGGAR